MLAYMKNLQALLPRPAIYPIDSYHSSSDPPNRHLRLIRSTTHGSKCRGSYSCPQYCYSTAAVIEQFTFLLMCAVLGAGSGKPIIRGFKYCAGTVQF